MTEQNRPDTSVESLAQPSPYRLVPSVATNETQASEVLTSEVLIALTAAQVVEIERACRKIVRQTGWLIDEDAVQIRSQLARIRRALKGG